MSAMLLAGDVRGTKTTLGLFPLRGEPKKQQVETTFPSAKYLDLESIVREFLAQNRAAVRYASFGVAGMVIGGQRMKGMKRVAEAAPDLVHRDSGGA